MKNIRIIALLLVISIFSTLIISKPITVKANSHITFHAEYIGTYDSNDDLIFSVYNVDVKTNTFNGHIYYRSYDNSSFIIDKDVSGNITFQYNFYTCSFDVSYIYSLFSNTIHFDITVYPQTGTAVGSGTDGFLFWDEDFELQGTINKFYDEKMSYNEEDMKMCMALSRAIYIDDEELSRKQSISSVFKFFNLKLLEDELKIYNDDANPDNVLFAILNRQNDDNSIDMIVVIRGTYNEEWQGNVQITGNTYDSSITVHDNFNKAKDSIKDDIKQYYDNYCANYDEVNLIITGHSRGAAVANLYAKEATDLIGIDNSIETDIPIFDSVTAYTFACPNNVKVTANNHPNYLKSYKNIFNLWFSSDIVPSVPLTNPTNDWNYWKYGQCYTLDISNYSGLKHPINNNIKYEMSTAFSQWPSVQDYYNKELKVLDYISDLGPIYHNTSLYSVLYNATYFKYSSFAHKFLFLGAINDALKCPELKPLLFFAASNISTIANSHNYETYNSVINGGKDIDNMNNENAYSTDSFNVCTYEDVTYQSTIYNNSLNTQLLNNAFVDMLEDDNETDNTSFNLYEVQKLTLLANYNNNNDILCWDLTDPLSWEGITWGDDGHITKIELPYKWLTGSLNCSNFIGLRELNVYANSLSSIYLSGDTSLELLDCSFNNLSESGLDLSDCTSLSRLYCDGSGLSTLDLSNLVDLQELSCGFNELIALDIEDNANLEHISCPYNYLDIHKGGTLYTQLQNYRSTNHAYINYYPQRLPNNAVIDTNELQALENFAKIGNNNTVLDWLDEEGNISIDKVQNNVLFEFDGERYKIVAIDISEYDVEGALDLTAFTYLRYLYCNDTEMTSINAANCTSLEELDCSNSQLNSLYLPTNITSDSSNLNTLYCQNNHLDINIFTNDIVNSIKSKGDIDYRHQLINADVLDFYEDDYNALVDFANQNNNIDELDWDLDNPGYWDNVNWKFDTTANKYRLLDCYFDYLGVSGNADFSVCDKLEDYSFAGTEITSAIMPSNIPNGAFYDCERLEAVILSDDTTCIGDSAFKYCTSLQAVYMPDSVTTIGNDVFKYSPNVKIAGVSDSFAENYATTSNIPFEAGYFVCANVVTKEAADGNIEHFYPVEGVNLLDENNETVSISDKYGYFVLFGLNEDDYTNILSYKYGYDLEMISHISNSSIIVLTPIQMVSYDFVKDGYINAKDYKCFVDMKKNDDTDENYNCYDIDKNGIVDESDWCFAQEFFLQNNSIKDTVEAGYDSTNYLIAPLSLNNDPDNSSGSIEVGGIEDIYVEFD